MPDYSPSKLRDMARLQAERAAVSLAAVEALLPLPKNATFEELMEISNKVPGSSRYYPRLQKAIKAHPAYKKVIADLNTGVTGRNYAFLKRPDIQLGAVNKIYKEVKGREGIADKTLEAIYKRAGSDPVKLVDEYNNLTGKSSGAKLVLETKLRALPAYKEFLEYDKPGLSFAKYKGIKKSKLPSREFLRFQTYLNFAKELPEGTKFSDYISLDQLEKAVGKKIVTPGKSGGSPRYKLFDYNQILKFLGEPIVSADKRRFFPLPTDQQVSELRRFFKDGTYLYGKDTESIVRALHNKPKLQKLLEAKKFPELHEFKPELEKVLKKSVTDAQAAHGTRIYSDWTKGALYKNLGLDFKPSASEVKLGTRIYTALEGFHRYNPWARGEYDHAMREIKRNMPKEAGSLKSFKSLMSDYLPKGFLDKKNLNVNEIFSIKQTARNKSFPYAYFVDVIDADINQKNLAAFQGKLSTAVADTRNLISRLRAGDPTVSYADIADRIEKFQSERAAHAATIKRNFPGKNVNIADIVLGSEKEILKRDFDIADRVYSAKHLNKWKKQGIDIAGHAKTEGYAMTGASKHTSFLFRDLVNVSKELWKKGSSAQQYEVAFKLKCVGYNASGGRIGFALGTGAINCVNTKIANQPVESTKALSTLDEGATGVLGKVRNTARGFLGVLGKFGPTAGKYGAIMAAGALAQPLVKQFMNDDPFTYLTDPDQQAGMLEALIEGERPKPPSEILDTGLTGAHVAATAAAVPGTSALWKARRQPFTRMVDGVPKTRAGMGMPRAALGPVGKFIAGAYTPAGLLATEPLRIAQMRREGESWGEVAKSPTLWMGPAFADTMTKMATSGMKRSPLLARALSLGMSRPMLKTISRRFGMPGLALSLGLSGYDLWKDYKKKRGFFAKD